MGQIEGRIKIMKMKRTLIVLILFISLVSVKAQTKEAITIKLNCTCTPINNPKILSSPNPKSLHPNWENDEVFMTYSFISTKKIENKDGVFLFGNLISPRGFVITKGCYIIYSEWKCSK